MHYVLVVSDDEEDTAFLGEAFRAQPGNISVTCLSLGLAVLDFIATRLPNEFPFLIVIDQYLRDVDSLVLLAKIKADQYSRLIPVAMMSGFASEELIREYYRSGANCFYKKPLDMPDWNHMADCLLTLFHSRY